MRNGIIETTDFEHLESVATTSRMAGKIQKAVIQRQIQWHSLQCLVSRHFFLLLMSRTYVETQLYLEQQVVVRPYFIVRLS